MHKELEIANTTIAKHIGYYDAIISPGDQLVVTSPSGKRSIPLYSKSLDTLKLISDRLDSVSKLEDAKRFARMVDESTKLVATHGFTLTQALSILIGKVIVAKSNKAQHQASK